MIMMMRQYDDDDDDDDDGALVGSLSLLGATHFFNTY
jgi:hypothetical protein